MTVSSLSLDLILSYAAKVARTAFNEKGVVAPMFAGHTAENDVVIVMPDRFDTPAEKAAAFDATRQVFKERGVVMFAFMTEAWLLEAKDTTPQSIARVARTMEGIANHPDRREAVHIMAEDRERCIVGIYYILRPEHGKPSLSPFKKLGPMTGMRGRMAGLLS